MHNQRRVSLSLGRAAGKPCEGMVPRVGVEQVMEFNGLHHGGTI
jgi:hypothetical protein